MNEAIDLLGVIMVNGSQAATLTNLLNGRGFGVTEIASQISMVEQTVTTLMIGTQRERLEELAALVRQCCPSHLQYVPARLEPALNSQPLMVEALVGGATLFAFEVEQFIQL